MSRRIARRVKFISLSLSLILAGGSTALAGEWRIPKRRAKAPNPVGATATSLESGLEIYAAECESCHGVSGRGDGPKAAEVEGEMPDLKTPDFADQSDGALYWKITVGRKPMPGFRREFSEEERWDLVNYLRTLMDGSAVEVAGTEPAGSG